MPSKSDEVLRAQKELLFERGVHVSAPRGVSMLPMLIEGKSAVELRTLNGLAKPLDVVLFLRPNGQNVLHRVMSVGERDYFIVGDNCAEGEVVPHEQVIGVMTGFYRTRRWVSADDKGYLRYARFWVAVYPVRRHLLRGRDRLRGLLSRIKRKLISI